MLPEPTDCLRTSKEITRPASRTNEKSVADGPSAREKLADTATELRVRPQSNHTPTPITSIAILELKIGLIPTPSGLQVGPPRRGATGVEGSRIPHRACSVSPWTLTREKWEGTNLTACRSNEPRTPYSCVRKSTDNHASSSSSLLNDLDILRLLDRFIFLSLRSSCSFTILSISSAPTTVVLDIKLRLFQIPSKKVT